MQNRIINIVDDASEWNSFVDAHTTETFHQSWEWGQVYLNQGYKVWYVGLYENGGLIATSLVIKVLAKRGRFLLVPHGPIFASQLTNDAISDILGDVKKYLADLARSEKCIFVRIAPISNRTPENDVLYVKNGFRDAPIFVQSEDSLVLNLEPSAEDLLKNMRKSTRYILKNKERFNIQCERTPSPHAVEDFCNLYLQTVSSQGFFGQSTAFITEEYLTFLKSGKAALYFAKHNGQLKAAALIIEQNNIGYYHYGASVKADSSIPAPHVLQWFIINSLKERGLKQYNFWGVAPENKPNHPWAGLSLFKKGFGGDIHAYTKTKDLILSQLYWSNWLVEKARSIKRGY